MPYHIDQHRHLFAQWAAGRAASAKDGRFSGEDSKAIIECARLDRLVASPDLLPLPEGMDATHREWRTKIIEAAQSRGIAFTHGVAAKLINIYFKSIFVCGGYHDHIRVRALHPPIDRELLKQLAKCNCGGERVFWRSVASGGWTKFNSEQYEEVIAKIHVVLGDKPLWSVEEYWRGYQ